MKGAAILLLVGAVAGARANVTSYFDLNNEGWTSSDVRTSDLAILSTGSTTWESGHIKATEFGSQFFVLVGPAKFLGDKSSFYGGTVSYRLSDTVRDGAGYPNLLLRGNGVALAYVTPPPAAAGTDYSIPLTETGWIGLDQQPATAVQFRSALANLDVFAVSGDWRTFGQDVTTLDNVVLASPVPEPATLVALALGIAGIARRRTRKPL